MSKFKLTYPLLLFVYNHWNNSSTHLPYTIWSDHQAQMRLNWHKWSPYNKISYD